MTNSLPLYTCCFQDLPFEDINANSSKKGTENRTNSLVSWSWESEKRLLFFILLRKTFPPLFYIQINIQFMLIHANFLLTGAKICNSITKAFYHWFGDWTDKNEETELDPGMSPVVLQSPCLWRNWTALWDREWSQRGTNDRIVLLQHIPSAGNCYHSKECSFISSPFLV